MRIGAKQVISQSKPREDLRRLLLLSRRASNCQLHQDGTLWPRLSIWGCRWLAVALSAESQASLVPGPRACPVFLAACTRLQALGLAAGAEGKGIPQPQGPGLSAPHAAPHPFKARNLLQSAQEAAAPPRHSSRRRFWRGAEVRFRPDPRKPRPRRERRRGRRLQYSQRKACSPGPGSSHGSARGRRRRPRVVGAAPSHVFLKSYLTWQTKAFNSLEGEQKTQSAKGGRVSGLG
ncbi:uncharacterized protein LOC120888395 [Ictidomys tridecemlineatus]